MLKLIQITLGNNCANSLGFRWVSFLLKSRTTFQKIFVLIPKHSTGGNTNSNRG